MDGSTVRILGGIALTLWEILDWCKDHPDIALAALGLIASRFRRVREWAIAKVQEWARKPLEIFKADLEQLNSAVAKMRSEQAEALVLGLFNQALLEHRIDQSEKSQVVKLDARGALIWGSAHLFEATGYELEDLYGPSFLNLFENGDRLAFEAVMRRSMERHSAIDARLRIRTSAGAVTLIRLRGRPVIMGGNAIGAVCHLEPAA